MARVIVALDCICHTANTVAADDLGNARSPITGSHNIRLILSIDALRPYDACVRPVASLVYLTHSPLQDLNQPMRKKLATVTAHRELTVTKTVTASRDLGRDHTEDAVIEL